jgi:hypothetical protein
MLDDGEDKDDPDVDGLDESDDDLEDDDEDLDDDFDLEIEADDVPARGSDR